jgi:tetratricopeptide (TPR) repeat protein
MKKILLFLFISSQLYSQDYYFQGKILHCTPNNSEAKSLFNDGIELLHLNHQLNKKYLAINADIFGSAIMKDTTFCDAYFFAGYTLNLLGKYRESYAFHKMADTLAPKAVLLYKQNLAAVCLKIDLIKEAREKYKEIVTSFPRSPEGYYGIAVTSLIIGDYSNGVQNAKRALDNYESTEFQYGQTLYIKGILLTLDKQYTEALSTLKEVPRSLKKDDNFNMYFSLSLLQVSISTNDLKMKKESLKYYNKIKDKNNIPEDLKPLFNY